MTTPNPTPTSRRLTLATKVTLVRIALALLLGPAILILPSFIAAILVLIIGLSDFLDGYLARARNEVTPLGASLDPVADKLVTASALMAFAIDGSIAGLHLLAGFAILLREILVTGLREASPEDIKLPVSRLAKWKTASQFLAFIVLCFGASVPGVVLLWGATYLTLATGVRYCRQWWASVSSTT